MTVIDAVDLAARVQSRGRDAETIEAVFHEFRIDGRVTGKTVGPSVTRYEIELGPGVRVNKVSGLRDNLAYALASESVRVLAPIPGKTAVGVELPNVHRETVRLDDIVIEGDPLEVALGKGIDGEMVTLNLGQMPHLLVAGTTGSGKSSFVNTMLVSLLRQTDPEQVKMILIDPKVVEFAPYRNIPHLLRPVVTEVGEAMEALQWVVDEMEERYTLMSQAGVRHISGLAPYIVVVIDELADLMISAGKQVEALITRIAQKARAAGIHLVAATQRPSVDVVTGLLKSNIPSRLAFSVATNVDSRVILDEGGAEQLLGKGDGLFKPVGARNAIRIQCAYVTDQEIAEAVEKVKVVRTVEDMRDSLSPEPSNNVQVIDYLNQMIRTVQETVAGGEGFMKDLEKQRRFGGESVRLMSEAPGRLGHTLDVLEWVARGLAAIRDEALEA